MFKIYKITSPQEIEYCYIGKTKCSLNVRFDHHKHGYKKWQDGRMNYITSFEIVQYPDATIELVEDGLDESKAVERERYWISQFNTVNKQLPGRTDYEYRQDNRERISEYKKQYHEANRDMLNEKAKQYRIDNRERLSAYYTQKITCECGCISSRQNMRRHIKTIKHQQQLAALQSADGEVLSP